LTSSLLTPAVFAVFAIAFGTWMILRPDGFLNRFLHSDDRARLVGHNWQLFVKILGAFFILLGVAQFIDRLVH